MIWLMPKSGKQKRDVMVEEQPNRYGVMSPEREESLSGDWYAPFEGP